MCFLVRVRKTNADESTNSRMDNELDDRGSRPSDRFEAITTVGGVTFGIIVKTLRWVIFFSENVF